MPRQHVRLIRAAFIQALFMKSIPRVSSAKSAAIFAALVLTVPPAFSQLPNEAAASVAPGVAANTVNVTVTDPGNHVWKLQSSPNFQTWTDVETIKVHNGHFQRTLTHSPAAPALFYRHFYSSAEPNIPSTTASALLLPVAPFNYANPPLPPHLLAPPIVAQINTPANNPITNAGANLGRILFWDKRLSLNQTVACASCHQPEHGFSDPRKFSVGFQGGLTGRNSMGLTSNRYYLRRAYFWDERAATLEVQVLQPIQNAVEMGMTLPALEARLGAEPYYTDLFNQVFGTPAVTSNRISLALAQFVRSIISTQTKYDAGVPLNFSNFTAQENQGRQIFGGVGNCVACHGSDNFVPGNAINNNGLEFPFVDLGRGGITGLPQDNGLFKVPSLRNIELTAPYMHDGRFATLEEVVEFYNSGVVDNPNLSPPLRNPPGSPGAGQPRRLNLTVAQKAALVAFLKTFTDTSVTTGVKFSDPFNYGN